MDCSGWRGVEGGLIAGLQRCDQIGQLTPEDRALAERARELLARWRQVKDHIGLAATVRRILDDSGFEAALVCEFLGARKLANCRKLVLLAREFDRQGGFTLTDLVVRLRGYLDEPPREELAAATDEQSTNVRLMSIHQAKGLEFPIVVVPDLNRQGDPRTPWLAHHPELGLVVRPAATPAAPQSAGIETGSEQSVGYLAYTAIEHEEDRKEAIRLFYVAATRARDALILSAGLPADPDPKPQAPALELLWERFAWESGECLAALPAGWPAPRVEVVMETPPPPPAHTAGPGLAGKLAAIERVLVEAEPVSEPPPARRLSPGPRLIVLEPERVLTTHSARLNRLIRSVFADKGLLRGEALAAVCARLAVRQVPAAGSSLITEALQWLEGWTSSPLFHELCRVSESASDSRKRGAIQRDCRWTLEWSDRGAGPIVIHGQLDVVYRDSSGAWRPVLLGTAAAADPVDRLRLLLSARAARQLGFDPVGPAWRLTRCDDGKLTLEQHTEQTGAGLDEAVAAWHGTL